MPYLKVVQLVGDLLARLANEERLVLQHRGVELFESEGGGNCCKLAKQPVAQAHVLREEVTRACGKDRYERGVEQWLEKEERRGVGGWDVEGGRGVQVQRGRRTVRAREAE